jgi:type I restriction enzyme S subunit
MSYPVYEEMQDSGVEWLGDVPKGWDVVKIKHLSSVKRGASPRPIDDPIYFDDNGEYAWVRISDVTASNGYLEQTTQRLSDIGSSLSVKLNPGSLFLSIAGSVGKACITKIKSCIHDGFVYFPNLKVNSKFLFYVFDAGQAYRGLGKLGTQLNLNTDTVGDIRIGVPSSEGQRCIVAFLDTKTGEIDELIALKEQQVALLQQKRMALISRAVTKGFDPHAPMRESGIAWLGEVPEGWNVLKVKFVATKIGSGKTPRGGATIYGDEGVVFLRSQNIYDDGLRLEDVVFISDEIDSEMSGTRVYPGDVLLNITGASIGRTSVIPRIFPRANVNQHVCIIRPAKGIIPEYLSYCLKSSIIKQQILSFENGSSREGLNFEQVGELIIVVPQQNLFEQNKVITYLDRETAQIDSLVATIQEQIEKLRSYRQALITAAVTGKIDVQGTHIPAEMEG